MMGRIWANRLSRRDLLRAGVLSSAALASGALAGCAGVKPGGQPAPAAGGGNASPARAGGTLIFGQGTGPANLDPIGPSSSTPTLGYWRQIFDTLVWRDKAGKIVPQLATSWKNVDDKTWEFKLREGVKFHNGEPFDANTVKFTIERILDPNQKATVGARFTDVSSVEVVDPTTVRILTKGPFPVLLLGLTQAYMVPPKYTAQEAEKAAQFPIGTGPFKFVDYTQGDRMNMAANETYWGGRPKLDKLVFRIIPDDATRLAALKAGEIHIDMNLPLDAIDAVASDPNLKEQHAFIAMALIVEFDTLHGGPMANPKVRQALNYAVDKEAIAKDLLRGKMRPLQGQLITEGVLGHNPNVKGYPYDPAKAKQLLAEAGVPADFEFTLNGPIGKYMMDKEIITAIAGQLEKVGIKAKANPMEYGLFVQKLVANQLGPMFMIGWYSFGDPALAEVWLTSKSTLGHYYEDATFDKLVADASASLEEKVRQDVYFKAAQHMHDEALALYLFQPATYYGVSKKVAGFEPRDDEIAYFYETSLTD